MAGKQLNPALQLLAISIAEIVGERSEVYRDILRAVTSGQVVDEMLAQASFDALPGETRRRIAERVEQMVAERARLSA
ncbi:MAG: hypothetical protein OHK0024_31280 [Thalassobaculales bacterium]